MGVSVESAKPWAWPLGGSVVTSDLAVIAIDLQRDFLDTEGWFARMGFPVTALEPVVESTNTLVDSARGAGALVVWTRQGNAEDLSDLPPFKLRQGELNGSPIGTTGPLGRGLVRGEPGWQLIENAHCAAGDLYIDKPGYSAFHGTDLAEQLAARSVTAIILCGVTTNVCVLSTLLAATDLGYDCLVAADATGAATEELRDSVLDLVAYQGGLFGCAADTDSVVNALTRD